MPINSRQKGKRGELELARLLREYGYDAHRSVQYSGANHDADLYGVDGFHIECKRVEQLNIYKAMEQSERDAREGEIPIVCHRKDRKGWLVTIRFDDFMGVIK